MKTHPTYYGLSPFAWLLWILTAIAIGVAIPVVVSSLTAQHHNEPPQLVSFSAQPVYDAAGFLIAFPVTVRHKITDKPADGSAPKSWIQTTEFDLVHQAQHTMALDGETVELGSVRDDIINVAGALHRLHNPPPLPRMTRKAIRGNPK